MIPASVMEYMSRDDLKGEIPILEATLKHEKMLVGLHNDKVDRLTSELNLKKQMLVKEIHRIQRHMDMH